MGVFVPFWLPLLKPPTLCRGHAFGVFAGACIDLYAIALVDENRHVNLKATVDLRRLKHIGGGIATRTGLGIGDHLLNEDRQLDLNGFVIVIEDLDAHIFREEVLGLAQDLRADVDLFEVIIHKDIVVTILVRVMQLHLLELRLAHLIIGTVLPGHRRSGDHVLHLAGIDRLPLTGFGEGEIRDGKGLPLDLDLQPFSQI